MIADPQVEQDEIIRQDDLFDAPVDPHSGTFACPICGVGRPHEHSSQVVADYHAGTLTYDDPRMILEVPNGH